MATSRAAAPCGRTLRRARRRGRDGQRGRAASRVTGAQPPRRLRPPTLQVGGYTLRRQCQRRHIWRSPARSMRSREATTASIRRPLPQQAWQPGRSLNCEAASGSASSRESALPPKPPALLRPLDLRRARSASAAEQIWNAEFAPRSGTRTAQRSGCHLPGVLRAPNERRGLFGSVRPLGLVSAVPMSVPPLGAWEDSASINGPYLRGSSAESS